MAISWLLATSCQPNERTIWLRTLNNAHEPIEYLAFSNGEGHGRTRRFVLAPGDSVRTQLRLEGKGDGDYWMRYKFTSSKDTLACRFGYYTNGSPVEKELILTIDADTVLVSRIPLDSY